MAKKRRKFHLFIWLIYLILGGFLVEMMLKKKNSKKAESFMAFLRAESKELKQLETGEEGLIKFMHDSKKIFHDYFIPHEGNNHKPKVLHARTLASIVLGLFIMKSILIGFLFFSFPEGAYMSEAVIKQVIASINVERESLGIAPLKENTALDFSALAKANDIAEKDYFAHTSPDGRKPWDFIDRSQYPYLFVGENLAMNFTTAESVHKALMNSPSHKKNIINDRYDEVGLAMVSGTLSGKKTNILVQIFATRFKPEVALASIQGVENTKVAVDEPKAEETDVLADEPKVLAQPESEKTKESNITITRTRELEGEAVIKTETIKVVSATNDGARDEAELPLLLTKSDGSTEVIKVSPNKELQSGKEIKPVAVSITVSKNLKLLNKIAKTFNYILAATVFALILALMVNIFVRFEIQHRPVIIQSVLAIILVGSLWYIKLHHLERGLVDILIL